MAKLWIPLSGWRNCHFLGMAGLLAATLVGRRATRFFDQWGVLCLSLFSVLYVWFGAKKWTVTPVGRRDTLLWLARCFIPLSLLCAICLFWSEKRTEKPKTELDGSYFVTNQSVFHLILCYRYIVLLRGIQHDDSWVTYSTQVNPCEICMRASRELTWCVVTDRTRLVHTNMNNM
jgi:hypothetical protein